MKTTEQVFLMVLFVVMILNSCKVTSPLLWFLKYFVFFFLLLSDRLW